MVIRQNDQIYFFDIKSHCFAEINSVYFFVSHCIEQNNFNYFSIEQNKMMKVKKYQI